MSWQSYVDDNLMREISGAHLTAAAILDHDGNPRAQSADFPQVESEEMTAIIDGFIEPATLVATNGLYLGGEKYIVVKAELGVAINGKKGTAGVVIKKTPMFLIIGTFDAPMTLGQCSNIVETLGNYLTEVGY